MTERKIGGCPYLNKDDIENIAERAAEKAVEKMNARVYQEVGKGFINKFLWAVGVITISFAVWLSHK